MKLFSSFLSLLFLVSCDRQPFVETKVKFERAADDCNSVSARMKMISNFGGERFELQKCLPGEDSLRKVVAERRGDTVWVQFAKPIAGQALATFDIILDIDSYPKYKFVTIDDMTYELGEAEY